MADLLHKLKLGLFEFIQISASGFNRRVTASLDVRITASGDTRVIN